MMQAKLSNIHILRDFSGKWRLEATVEAEQVKPLQSFLEELKDRFASAELKVWREKRSLDANAYFHVLCEKIARAVNAGNDETKRNLVLEYGTQKRRDDDSPSWFVIPKGEDPLSRSKYPKWFTAVMVNGKEADAYIEYKETHTMDSAEMAALIDGTISEAKELDIETLPPIELERMVGKWEKTHGQK